MSQKKPHSSGASAAGAGARRDSFGIYRAGVLFLSLSILWIAVHVFVADGWRSSTLAYGFRLGGGVAWIAGALLFMFELGRRYRNAVQACAVQFRDIAENLPHGLVALDSAGKVRYVNAEARSWFPDLANGDWPPCHAVCEGGEGCCLCHAVRATQCRSGGALELATPNGKSHFRVTAAPAKEGIAGEAGLLLLFEDDTEHHAMEKRFRRALRLEAMGALATGVAHEINQPLTVMQMTSSTIEMLLERGEQIPSEQLMQRIRRISAETARISSVIGHMRALAHHEGDETLSDVPVNGTVDNALGLARAQLAAHGIRLQSELGPGELTARADPLQLEQVVLSLITNRVHALDAARNREQVLHIRTRAEGDEILLQIADAEIEGLIPNCVSLTESDARPASLGLSLAQELVNRWNGRFEVRSCPEGCLLFELRFIASTCTSDARKQETEPTGEEDAHSAGG